jgi:hypothetical protein
MPNEEMGSRTIPEPPDVATRTVLVTVAGFLGFVALAITGLFFYLKTEAPGALKQAVEHQFPAPTLQKSPQADLERFEIEQRKALSGYGWVDRQMGLVHIPIEEAMRIVATRGDHAYDALEDPTNAANPSTPAGVRP